MANEHYNKVVYGGNTLVDLTGDTVEAADVASGKTFHDKSGAPVTGTSTLDSDTSADTAQASEILSGKTAHARGAEVAGTMPNVGGVSGTIATVAGEYAVPAGYHDGSGKVSIDATEQSKLVASNIREGVTVLGVEGTMTGTEDVSAESPTVTPSTSQQVVTPSTGYNYLAQVTVAAIPYSEVENSAGGKTATIGAAPTSGSVGGATADPVSIPAGN